MHDFTLINYIDSFASRRVVSNILKAMEIQNEIETLKNKYKDTLIDLGNELHENDPGINDVYVINSFLQFVNLPNRSLVFDQTEYTIYQLEIYRNTDIDVGKTVKGFVVYYLYQDDELVYVGSSRNLKNRLKDHRKSKQFNRYTYTKCESKNDMLHLEAMEIKKHLPKYNVKIEKSPYE